MKILMVHKTYKGGVAVHVKEISNELKKRGFEVYEITRNEDLGMKSFLTSYQKMKKLFSEWSKEFDIIHAHDWSIAYPAVKSGIKNLVATFHGLPTNIIAKYFQSFSIKILDKNAIVISKKMKTLYPNATLIYAGVNLKKFSIKSKNKNKVQYVGIAQKYNAKRIEKIAMTSGFPIVIANNLPHNKMKYFYMMLHVFVSIPPMTTGFNMVWLEAMACEVPYIIGTNAGIGEILPIYKVSNFYELKTLLEKIKNGKLEPLRNQRKWIVKNNLTWEEHTRKLLHLYNNIAS